MNMTVRSLVVALTGSIALAGASPAIADHVTLKVGDVPPPRLTSGTNLTDYQGKIVIVSFFASWCVPCRKELPVLAAIQKLATRDRMMVFAVNWLESREK